jgi:hypothetical protein
MSNHTQEARKPDTSRFKVQDMIPDGEADRNDPIYERLVQDVRSWA